MLTISDKSFLSIVALLVIVTALSTAYLFLFRQQYDVIVEAPCDPTSQTCFSRDCSVEECPDNGYETYRMFVVSAADFATCTDNTCLPECDDGTIVCTEIVCGESEEDVCAQP